VVVGGQASRHRRARTLAGHQRPGADVLGHLFPWVLVFQGVGSMLFHGGLTVWGSALDAMSMFATTGLLVATNLHRLGWVGARGVLGLFATLMAVGVTLGFGSQALVVNLVFVQFSVILGSEALLGHQGRTSTSAYFRGGLAVYLAGSVVWFLSGEPGLPFCEPASPWQGHGLWHLTSAAAVWLFAQHAFRNLAGAEIPAFRPAAVPPSTAAVASRLEPLLGAGAEPEFGTR